jgi:hypothetical protein
MRTREENGLVETAVVGNDWLNIDDENLRKRISPPEVLTIKGTAEDIAPGSPTLELLTRASGQCFGRAAIWREGELSRSGHGLVTVGGLRACGLTNIVGVLVGSSLRAARDVAIPSIPTQTLHEWAKSQREARLREGNSSECKARIAMLVVALGVDPGDLPIVRGAGGWLTSDQLTETTKLFEEVFFVNDDSVSLAGGFVGELMLRERVFSVAMSQPIFLQFGFSSRDIERPAFDDAPAFGDQGFHARTVLGAAIKALSKAWGFSVKQIIDASSFSRDNEPIARVVGTVLGAEVTIPVDIIRRPNFKTA